MIRTAEQSDLPRLVEMGRRFREESSYRNLVDDNPEQIGLTMGQLIKQGWLLIAEHDAKITGMFGFVLHNHFFSGEKVAGEVFWWVEPEHRGDGVRLLREAERRAQAAGAKRMQMIAPTERVSQFYERIGYAFVESAWQRTL